MTSQLSITNSDFDRLETKVDKLTDALQQLVRVEERQTNQGARIGSAEKNLAVMEAELRGLHKKVDQWINRGIGLWAAVCTGWGVFQALGSLGIISGVK
jgi:hypothetical protein